MAVSAAELAILLSLKDSYSAELKNAQKNTESFGASIKNVQSIASGFLAAAAVQKGLSLLTQGFKSSLQAANDQAQAERQLNSVLTSTAGAAGVTAAAALDMSQQFQKSTRIQDEVVLSAENMLLTFTNIKANIFPQTTQAVLDMATSMKNGGIPSMEELKNTAVLVGKALNDPEKGMTALQRVGVAFTEQQKAQIKTMVESGNVIGAQKMILAELKTEFGGAAENMTPFERNMDKVKDAVEGAKESVGFFIQGGLNIISQWLSDHGQDILKFAGNFSFAFDAIKSQIGTQIAGIINFVKGLIDAIEGIADMVNDLANGRWAEAWTDLKDVAVNLGKAMLGELEVIFGQIPNLLIAGVNQAIDALNNVKLPNSLSILGRNVPIPGGGGGLNIPNIPNIPMPTVDWSAITKGFNSVTAAGKDLSKASTGAATDIGDLGSASKKTAGELLGDALSKIKAAATALFSQPTREFASLDLVLAQTTQAHRQMRPAIQDAIDAYNLDADAHEAAAKAIEDSAARMDEVLQVQIDQAQQHVQNLQDQFAKEDELRSNANKATQRAQEDRAAADAANATATQRRLQDQLDALRDQKDALPNGAEGADQRDALDKQINTLQDSLTKASRAAQDQSTALSEANRQLDRANEDSQAKLDAARKKASDEAAASLAWQQAQKKKADDDAKKAAEQERIEAGKAKDAAEADKRKLDQMDKEEAAMKLRLDALTGEHEIMKKRLVLADQSLLTEGQLKAKVDALIPQTETLTTRIMNMATSLGVDLTGGVRTLITELEKLKDLPAAILAGLGGGGGVPGHALGLPRVPYDNYLMFAHKDERVLTADEARAYNQHNDNSRRNYGATYNYYGSAGDSMELARLN